MFYLCDEKAFKNGRSKRSNSIPPSKRVKEGCHTKRAIFKKARNFREKARARVKTTVMRIAPVR